MHAPQTDGLTFGRENANPRRSGLERAHHDAASRAVRAEHAMRVGVVTLDEQLDLVTQRHVLQNPRNGSARNGLLPSAAGGRRPSSFCE
jgi:hypothetical protein